MNLTRQIMKMMIDEYMEVDNNELGCIDDAEDDD